MRAVVFDQFGPPQVLRIAELPLPKASPGQVVVRVAAATVNPTDLMMRSGQQASRMTHLKPPFIAGQEFAGYIHELGAPSDRLKVGQPVMGIVHTRTPDGGAHAEYVRVPEASVVPVPEDSDLVEMATIPMNGLTALMALQAVDLPAGATLLVTGGAGAVGGYLIQMAHEAGLVVVADAKDEDRDLLLRFGATHIVPRGEGMAHAVRARYPDGVDGLVDAALIGDAAAELVRDGGHVAYVRSTQVFDTERLRVKYVHVLEQIGNTSALASLAEKARSKVLTARVAHRISMADAVTAHQFLERGGLRGRVVLVP